MNWYKRIQDAKRRGYFTEGDKSLAISWVTCACGEQDKSLVDDDGVPFDNLLWYLGTWFANLVENNNIKVAETVLTEIQSRATFLLEGV